MAWESLRHASGEFDYQPPEAIYHPDGSVEVWEPQSKTYVTHEPGLKPTPPREWATGADAELFDPATMSERPGNPIVTFGDPDAEDTSPKFGANSLLDGDVDSESESPHIHDDTFRNQMTECPNCGTPTAEQDCPRCGFHVGDKAWRYQDRTPDPAPFNDNVPKRDMHKYDDMVPWGPGSISHYVPGTTASERDEMTDLYDPIQRMSIGRDDGAELNSCPECDHPMTKRASEGFEVCTNCGHKNAVVDAVVSSIRKEAPGKEHMKGVSPKRNRQYEHVLESLRESHPDWDEDKLKEVAARTVNKERAEKGETKEGGFADELKNLGGDVVDTGKDFYRGDVGDVAGDVLNMGADVGKGVAYGAKDHPLIAASLAAPFLLPAAGVGLGAMAGAEGAGLMGIGGEAAAAGGAGAVGRAALAQGLARGGSFYTGLGARIGIPGLRGAAPAAEGAAEGEAAAAGRAALPGRAKSLMRGAMSPTAAFTIGQHFPSGGGGFAPAGTSTPLQSTEGMYAHVLTPEETAERRAWSKNYDMFSHLAADDDQSSDLSTQNDGDDVTDPMTQGSQEETGDSLDELLKSLGDDGSAHADSYTDEQNAAIHSLNDNMPTILAFNLHDVSGKGHPLIEGLAKMLEQAFGEKILDGDDGASDDAPEKKDKPEIVIDEPKAEKKSAMPVTTPTPGQMQPQQQTSVTPCAICGGPHQTDQHPSAVQPPAQGGQFGRMTSVQLLEHVAARRPKMCPFHGDLVDYSLTLGDPVSARTAVRPSDYGANYCQSGEYESKCNFKPGMVTQEYWDEKEQARQERREQQLQEMQAPAPAEVAPEMPSDHEEVTEAFDIETEPVFEGDSAVGVGTMNDPAGEALQMAAKLIREAGVVPQGYKLNLEIEKTAAPDPIAGLQEGERYIMHSTQYDVPDDVTVQQVKHNSVVVVYHFPGGLDSAPQELTRDQLLEHGITHFESQAQEPQAVQEIQDYEVPDTAPDANEQTDMSQVHEGEAPEGEIEGDEGLQMAASAEDEDDMVDGRTFLDDDGEPIDYATYAANMKSRAPATMQWLWDDVQSQQQVSRRQQEMQAIIAGRQFSMREQADFIQEPGTARNHDKLDLSGTHYEDGEVEVPDDHLWLGL